MSTQTDSDNGQQVVAVSLRKQRLRALESQIRENYEAFVLTGFALMEIRDDELYKEDGFLNWMAYRTTRIGEEFGIDKSHADRLIVCAQVRRKLPSSPPGGGEEGWSQLELLELARLAPISENHKPRSGKGGQEGTRLLRERDGEEASNRPGCKGGDTDINHRAEVRGRGTWCGQCG